LARAAGADERADRAGGKGDGDAFERGRVGLIGEGDVFENQVAAKTRNGDGVGGIGDGDRLVEDVFEAIEGGGAALGVVAQRGELLDRLVADVEGGDERDERVLGQAG